MKKIAFYSTLLFCFVAFTGLSAFAQAEYRKPALENKESWSMIMIPDIQNYVKWGRNQPILDLRSATPCRFIYVSVQLCSVMELKNIGITNNGRSPQQLP